MKFLKGIKDGNISYALWRNVHNFPINYAPSDAVLLDMLKYAQANAMKHKHLSKLDLGYSMGLMPDTQYMINMILFFMPNHPIKDQTFKSIGYYSVHHWNSSEKFKCGTLPIHDWMKRSFLSDGAHQRDTIKECIEAEREYEGIINTIIEKAAAHYGSKKLDEKYVHSKDWKENQILDVLDERLVDSIIERMIPQIYWTEKLMKDWKEDVRKVFKADKFIADPFTEEFGPNKTPSTVAWDEVEK